MSHLPSRPYDPDPPTSSAENGTHRATSTSVPTFGQYNTQPTYPTTSSSPPELPRVGFHRCYWTLLSTDLRFIYLDPVLQFHLEEQATELLGESLLTFVHPDEQATAKVDLGEVLASKNFHGSITRTRFCRLSRVRRQLGHNGPPPSFPSAEKVSLDANYMAVDIVLNYAAEGLVLCFIHATADIDPASDNDKNVKSPWTNWCGTPFMSQEQIQLLSRRLLHCVPQTSSHDRVFQMLDNESGRTLLLSWPPDQSAQDFAAFAHTVNLSETYTEAKTNCTRRYKDSRHLRGVQVETVYIPHGSVIFACHKLDSPSSPPPSSVHDSSTSTTSIPNTTVATMGYNASTTSSYSLPPPQQQSSYYDQPPYTLPSLSSSSHPYSYVPPSQQHSNSVTPHYPSYSNWNSQPPTHPTVQSLRTAYWSPTSYESPQGGASLSLGGQSQTHDSYRPISPGYSAYTSASSNAGSGADHLNEDHASPISTSPSSADLVPPPRRRVSPGNSREYNRAENTGSGAREGRGHGNRPSGVLKCSSCKATTSPEWRKGPSGKKELCNACGLRYARSRAKKEGHVPSSGSRRRKDKILKRDTSPPASTPSPVSSGTPSSYAPSSSTIPYQASSTPPYGSTSSVRRSYGSSYEDSPFSSAGSTGSGSDIYAPHRSTGTPSPSPPAATTNFVPYNPSGSDSHGHRAGFYGSSVPSPLASNPPSMLPSQSFERESHRDGTPRDPQTPVNGEPKHYYETTSLRESTSKFNRLDKEDRPYDRSEYRAYEREERGRGLVSG
ncbi:hypothetical protein K435DRAFT_775111 [Dendrothele bispora CBS 962.96]|uniref:GATA-type domain-containing protein n=1 Tax=Dendrothele bispora (strain CBS 962.96) TaxID=1314807 RepID=A0A4S8MK73_DENBC|nr:hypothetical protein K435DRAFT_775111 [Dendrothele bispora CBS 962.96]